MAAASPTNVQDPTLRVTVTANGKDIQDLYPILSVRVHHEINRISYAEVVILDGTTSETQSGVAGDFPASDSAYFVPGATLVITAGYGLVAGTQIFTGIIVKQSIQANESGAFSLTVTCKQLSCFSITVVYSEYWNLKCSGMWKANKSYFFARFEGWCKDFVWLQS